MGTLGRPARWAGPAFAWIYGVGDKRDRASTILE